VFVCIVFIKQVKINQFLQAGHHNSHGSQANCKRNERTNHNAPNAIHVFDSDIVALALDSTEQSVILGLDVDDVVRVVHCSCACATDSGVRLSLWFWIL
jgi:hypothetical protein